MNPQYPPPVLQKSPSRFSLILAGGLARGAAHLGAWRALSEAKLLPERVVGVSIGSIIGGWLCKEGGTGEALDEIRGLAHALQNEVTTKGRNFWDTWRLVSLAQRRSIVEERLGLGGVTFRDLPLPLYVAATRLVPPGRVVFGDHATGSVAEAILASTAVVSHPPVRVEGSYFVDGGLSGNLPVTEAVKRGGRVVLAVDLGPALWPRGGKPGEVVRRFCRVMYRLMSHREIESSRAQGVTVVQVRSAEIEAFGLFAFEGLDRIEEEGYKATRRVLPALQRALSHLGDDPKSQRGRDGS